MKNNINKYLSIFALLILGLTATSCLEEEADFPDDSSAVIPTIFDMNGPTIVFVQDTGTYSVTSRGGSEYVWTVSGAEVQPIAGRTDKINVLYTQFEQLVSVSVKEVAANGQESEASTIDGIKVFGTPCDWTLDMQDAYGDGWNGASISFSFDGFAADELTNEGASSTGTIAVPNGSTVEVSYNSGAWDGEVAYQLYDANGALVASKVSYGALTIGEIYSGVNTCP
jgi:hypothetical protein